MPDISSTSSGDGDEYNDEQDAQKDGKEDDEEQKEKRKKEQRHDPAPAEIGDAAKKFRDIVSRHFLSLDL